jgi:hypothetical protein
VIINPERGWHRCLLGYGNGHGNGYGLTLGRRRPGPQLQRRYRPRRHRQGRRQAGNDRHRGGHGNGGTGSPPRRRRVDAIRLPPHRNRMDCRAPRQSGQVDEVPPAGKGRVVSASDSRNPEVVAFDPRKPNIARIYDALRDGKDNFGPDRDAAEAIREIAADRLRRLRRGGHWPCQSGPRRPDREHRPAWTTEDSTRTTLASKPPCAYSGEADADTSPAVSMRPCPR